MNDRSAMSGSLGEGEKPAEQEYRYEIDAAVRLRRPDLAESAFARAEGEVDEHLRLSLFAWVLATNHEELRAMRYARRSLEFGRSAMALSLLASLLLPCSDDVHEKQVEELLQEALREEPGYWHTYDSLGFLHRTRGRYGAAYRCFKKSVRIRSARFRPAGYELCQLSYLDGLRYRSRAALRWARKAVVSQGTDAEAWFSLAWEEFFRLAFDKAEEAVQRSLAIDPDDSRGRKLARALRGEGEEGLERFERKGYTVAYPYLVRMLEIHADSPLLRLKVALCRTVRTGKRKWLDAEYERSEGILRDTERLALLAEGLRSLAVEHSRSKVHHEALLVQQRLCQQEPSVENRMNLVAVLTECDRREEARELLQELECEGEMNALMRYYQAMIEEDPMQAIANCRKVLRDVPDYHDLRWLLAAKMLDVGQIEEGIDEVESLLRAVDTPAPAHMDILVRLYVAAGAERDARLCYEELRWWAVAMPWAADRVRCLKSDDLVPKRLKPLPWV